MNTCIITGLETNNKWKGQFIHRSAIDSAVRDYECSTRKALVAIQKEVGKKTVEGMTGNEYMDMLEKVLGLKDEPSDDSKL